MLLLGVTGLSGRSAEKLHGETPVAAGNHLRWSFAPWLGYPQQGFLVDRRLYVQSVVNADTTAVSQSDWVNIAKIRPPEPDAFDDAMDRIRHTASDVFAQICQSDARHALDVIDSLVRQPHNGVPQYRRPISSSGSRGVPARIRALSSLLLASIEPTIARLIGLYFIDGEIPRGQPADYRVTGIWHTKEQLTDEGQSASADRRDMGDMTGFFPGERRLELDGVSLTTVGAMELIRDNCGRPVLLVIEAPPRSGLRISFPYPVTFVRLVIKGDNRLPLSADAATISGSSLAAGDPRLRVEPGPDGIDVVSEEPIVRLQLFIPPNGTASDRAFMLGLISLAFHPRAGLTKLHALVAFNTLPSDSQPANGMQRPHPPLSSDPPLPRAPALQRVTATDAAPQTALDGNGEVRRMLAAPQFKFALAEEETSPHETARVHVVREARGEEVVTRSPIFPLRRCEKLVELGFDGTLSESVSRRASDIVGRVDVVPAGYTSSNIRVPFARPMVPQFDGHSAMRLPGRLDAVLRDLGDCFWISLWVAPESNAESGRASAQTLVGNSFKDSFWFGLAHSADGWRPRLWVNGTRHDAAGTIPFNQWSQLGAAYDGKVVRFWINGRADAVRDAVLGPVAANASGPICIGADSPALGSPLSYPFNGRLADLTIWRRRFDELRRTDQNLLAAWPMAQDGRELVRGDNATFYSFASGSPQLAPLPERLVVPGSKGPVHAIKLNGDGVLVHELSLSRPAGHELTLSCIINPQPASGGESGAQVLLSLGGKSGIALLLEPGEGGSHPALVAGGRRVVCPVPIAPNRWSSLAAGFDGGGITFVIDDCIVHTEPFRHIGRDLRARTSVEIGAVAKTMQNGYRGMIGAAAIWGRAPRPDAPALARYEFVPSSDAGIVMSPPFAHFIDRDAPEGTLRYHAMGIDLFGRLGRSGLVTTLQTIAADRPPAPMNLRARFIPVEGRITRQLEDLSVADLSPPETMVHQIDRHLITFARPAAEDPWHWLSDTGEVFEPAEQSATLEADFRIIQGPYALLRPEVGDHVRIEHDRTLRISWLWTGQQALYHPDVDRFFIHVAEGSGDRIGNRGNVVSVMESGRAEYELEIALEQDVEMAGTVDRPCRIGGRPYRLIRLTRVAGSTRWRALLRYRAYPIVPPRANESIEFHLVEADPAYRDAAEAQLGDSVRSVDLSAPPPIRIAPEAIVTSNRMSPSEVRDQLKAPPREVVWASERHTHRVVLPNVDAVLPTPSAANEFAPGALVGFDLDGATGDAWRVFDVIWHERVGRDLVVYVASSELSPDDRSAPNRSDDCPMPQRPPERPIKLTQVRYHLGTRKSIDYALPAPPSFSTGHIVNYSVAVTAVTRRGSQSVFAGPMRVPAVDRRLPPSPPRPRARIGRADVHGIANALIDWPHRESSGVAGNDSNGEDIAAWTPDDVDTRFLVYRATDSEIIATDLDDRKRRAGFYSGQSLEQILGDDEAGDFAAWRRARYPDLFDEDLQAYFFERSRDRDGDAELSPEAQQFWRAWRDWFYPSITAEEMQRLADRTYRAFTIVTPEPIDGRNADDAEHRQHVDRVNGHVSNQYYYRLRTVSAGGARSTRWGPASNGAKADRVRPPRAPRITRIAPGDRSIALAWNLTTDAELAGYKLYRAREREDLEDIRWFEVDPPEDGTVIFVPDPRPRALARGVQFARPSRFAAVRAVFSTTEFVQARADDTTTIRNMDIRSFYALRRPMTQMEFAGPLHANNLAVMPVHPASDPSGTMGTSITDDGETIVLTGLRRVPDGTALAIVYADEAGQTRVLIGASILSLGEDGRIIAEIRDGATPPYLDAGLQGRTDYYYRIVAQDNLGNRSGVSEIVRARTLEIAPPEPPILHLEREAQAGDDDVVRVIVDAPLREQLEMRVISYDEAIDEWIEVQSWQNAAPGVLYETQVEPTAVANFEVAFRTREKTIGAARVSLFSPPSLDESDEEPLP